MSAADGDCWLVGAAASGAWAGHVGERTCLQAGNWLFAAPCDGMTVYDEAAGQNRRYLDGWQAASAVPAPSGGQIVDSQARDAIGGLVAALVAGGILPEA